MNPLVTELLWAAVLVVWVFFVVAIVAKLIYDLFAKRSSHKVAVYYARKVIHILAGGLVALIIALYPIFSTPLIPFIIGLFFAAFTYIPHRTGKLMYWFQDPNNIYEVDFCVMWAVFITLGWYAGKQFGYNSPFLFGTLPLLFMAVGDGVTGIVRNALFKRRVKHWSGNLAMFVASATIATALGFGVPGLLSASFASIVERFERLGTIELDDNVTVPTVSFAVLYISRLFGL